VLSCVSSYTYTAGAIPSVVDTAMGTAQGTAKMDLFLVDGIVVRTAAHDVTEAVARVLAVML
jgi:hypothetical protein